MKLPNGWEEVPIFKYLDLVKSGVKKFEGIKAYIDTRSVETGIIKDKTTKVDYESKPSRANMQVQKGDVIFAKMKDTEKIYVIREEDSDHLYSTGFAILRVNDKSKLHPKYVYFWLRTQEFQRKKNKECTGATQKAINETKLRDFTIPVPPLDVQEKIIAVLEKAEQIKDWRKEADQLSKDYLKSVFVDMFGDPVINPRGWQLKKLPNFISNNKYSLKRGPFGGSLTKSMFVKEGYLVYEQNHAIYGDFTYGRYFITADKYKEMEMFKVEPGDLIVSCSGTMGKISEIPLNSKKGIINQALLKIQLDQNIMNNEFFKFVFRNDNFQKRLFGISHGSGISNFPSMSNIKDIDFICPPISLQRKFSAIVKKIKELNSFQLENLKNSQDLFNSLMQKAFKGELQ